MHTNATEHVDGAKVNKIVESNADDVKLMWSRSVRVIIQMLCCLMYETVIINTVFRRKKKDNVTFSFSFSFYYLANDTYMNCVQESTQILWPLFCNEKKSVHNLCLVRCSHANERRKTITYEIKVSG